MIQRVVRQISESGIKAEITVATSISQRDSVVSQLGDKVNIVTEPSRHNTFPAICLACEYLKKVKGCPEDESIIVMPCDPFTETGYYEVMAEMAKMLDTTRFNLILMGVKPVYPSAKYGYILPRTSFDKTSRNFKDYEDQNGYKIFAVEKFIEKPSVCEAENLISEGAFWNAGVFAFKLDYILEIAKKFVDADSFQEIIGKYDSYPKISFDHEIAEKSDNMGMVPFSGFWKDLGTWNTLTDELKENNYGNVITDGTSVNTHIFNELNIPLLCLGTQNLVIAASPDGIIVSEKSKSENVKEYAGELKSRPMIEERRWGSYKVVDYIEFPDHFHALTKQLTLDPGKSISYQCHNCRDEVWTFIDGEGEIVLNGERKPVKRGDVIKIPKGMLHALKATTSLTFIEVQHGTKLIEEDIERFPLVW